MESREQLEQEFLEGLNALSKKTGIVIDGCGCCSSPYLYEIKESDFESIDYHFASDNEQVMWRR